MEDKHHWMRIKLMGIIKKPLLALIFIIFFIPISTLANIPSSVLSTKYHDSDLYFQIEKSLDKFKVKGEEEDNGTWLTTAAVRRRMLRGPGSSPPRCSRKCGRCSPCTAVHVAVPPGTLLTAEYYPEAWRCKCHNKLYNP